MTQAAPKAIAITRAIDDLMRRDRGRLIAGLTTRLGDLQLAEDALQDAMISALRHWAQNGLPDRPDTWLLRVALNKAIDRIRKANREAAKARNLEPLLEPAGDTPDETIPDERLRLIFACCHPGLDEKSRIALTLRTVCGLTTREIAAGFLDAEPTMGQRITRAKSKIKTKGIRFSIPEPDQWTDRLDTVLTTIHLIFTTGYVSEDRTPRDLCAEALFLARLLHKLCPEDPEILGALALMLLTHARRSARVGPDGAMVPVDQQDRTLWQVDAIQDGQGMLAQALTFAQPGPFQIKAAIADCHMADPVPDWMQMALLYQSLWRFEPTPVVALNWAVVLAETGHTETALHKLDELSDALATYQPLHAARADMLARLGRGFMAKKAYDIAIQTAPTTASRLFLEKRRRLVQE